MFCKNKILNEVYEIFMDGPQNGSTEIHSLIISVIQNRVRDDENHITGKNFYIEEDFKDLIKPVIPSLEMDDFKLLFHRCLGAFKLRVYYKVGQIVPHPEKQFFSEQAKLLGDQAEDIAGAAYLRMPVIIDPLFKNI